MTRTRPRRAFRADSPAHAHGDHRDAGRSDPRPGCRFLAHRRCAAARSRPIARGAVAAARAGATDPVLTRVALGGALPARAARLDAHLVDAVGAGLALAVGSARRARASARRAARTAATAASAVCA